MHSTCLFLALGVALFAIPVRAEQVASDVLPTTLDELLDRSGTAIESFWRQVPAVACTERMVQRRLGSGDDPESERVTENDYLMSVNFSGYTVRFEESRLTTHATDGDDPMLVTSGFAALLAIFHGSFRNSFRFSPEPGAGIDPALERVRFEHIPGSRSPTAIRIGGRDYPIPWNGVAEIDPTTGHIVRIVAELAEPLDDLGLVDLRASTEYDAVRFADASEPYWLPGRATIVLASATRRWENVHEINDCRKFSVDIQIAAPSTGTPESPASGRVP